MNAGRLINLQPSLAAGFLLAVMFVLMTLSSLHKPLSYDEPNNLLYGHQLLTLGPGTVPDGQRMPVLALHALACLPYQCDFETLRNSEMARFLVRFPSMLFALLTGILIFKWGKELFSAPTALFPLFLYCLNPNFIAHGKQLTTDIHTVFFVLASVYFFWKFHKAPALKHLLFCSLMTGLAILSKYSGLILLPILTLLFLIHFRMIILKRENFSKILGGIFIFGAVIWLVINSGYFFSGAFTKASDYQWQSKRYQTMLNSPLPLPLPKVFMKGMDYTQYLEENPNIGRGNNYIFGKRRRKGRWYVFPSMIALKTPLAFFILLGMGLAVRRTAISKSFFLIPFAGWLTVFSLACDAQLGIRYVLPGFVFLFLLTGLIFSGALSKTTKYLISGLSLWYAVSALSYHPHQMSYFNELIGNRINSYKYLADSNLDWEDKSYFLKKFQAKHPELQIDIKPAAQSTGHFILSANDYTGVLDEREYEFLREHFKPLRHVTYSHYLFYVPPKKGDTSPS